MKQKISYAKESFEPLFRKGDKFIIVRRNNNPQLMPVEARHLYTREVFGFEEGELENGK